MNRIAFLSLFTCLFVFTAPFHAQAAEKTKKLGGPIAVATPTPTPSPSPSPTPEPSPAPTPAGTPVAPENKKGSRAPIDSNNVVRINYGNPIWNRNSAKIDEATILMREGTTGRMVQIHLEEDAPDSAGVLGDLFDQLAQHR